MVMDMNMDLGQTLMALTSVDLTTMDMDMNMDLGQTLMVQTSVDLTTMDMDMNMDLGQTLMALTSMDLTTMDMNMVLAWTLMVQTSFLDQGLLDLTTMVLDLDLVQTGVKLGIF